MTFLQESNCISIDLVLSLFFVIHLLVMKKLDELFGYLIDSPTPLPVL